MKKIKRINVETKEEKVYNSIQEASKDIKTKTIDWKVQLNIAYAVISGTKAYKSIWEKIK